MKPPWYRRYYFWVLLVIAGYFLWMEHRAHVIAYLPLALLATCVGIHFLVHGPHGHGAHGATQHSNTESKAHPDTLSSNRDSVFADGHGDTR